MQNISFPRAAAASVLSIILIALSLFIVHRVSATPPPTEVSQLTVCFVNAGQSACVKRITLLSTTTLTDEVRSLTQLLLAGPAKSESAHGAQSSLPEKAQLASVEVSNDRVNLELIFPQAFLSALTDQQVEDINEQFRITFTPYNFQRIDLNVRRSDGVYQPLSKFLKPIEQPHKGPPSPTLPPPHVGDGHPLSPTLAGEGKGGGLENKTVFISAGHGWYWNSAFGAYKTQRPIFPSTPYPSGEGIIEDFNNAEAVNQYLLSYLENAGADVWPVRERDMNTAMLIIDNNSPNFSTQGNWTNNNHGYDGTYRSATTRATSIATATWTFTPTITATYAVYVWFPTSPTPAVDAHFFIEHAGATTPVTIPQTRDADTWRYLGRFPFYGGQAARIYLTNQSSTLGVTVLADAVRIGGGMADTSAPDTSVISGKPRWEEQAWTYAKWLGLTNVYSYNDTIVRPIYAEWEKDPGEDAVYIAWHTNGFTGYNTVARGTETYIHSFQPTPNSDLLQNSIHSELINDIHAGWDPGWPDRGQKAADYGELRLLSTMPGVLIENGFHDNPIDVDALKDPRFLQLSARAIYQGLVRYWHAIDPNVPLTFLPEPPQQVMVRNSGPGQITISWKPGPIDSSGLRGDSATAYRVYTSSDGFGWSNPIDVDSTVYTLTGLLPNQLIFVKVTGVNGGGESFTSPVLAARTPTSTNTPLLIVYGFDRIDRLGDVQQYDAPEGVSRRVFIDRINRFDAIIQHATAIRLPFDSVQRAAVSSGAIGLSQYTLVDWIAGEEQTPFTALSTSDQTALTNFLNGGGALFISGAQLGSELRDTPFYRDVLHAAYVADVPGSYTTTPTANGLFQGLGPLTFDDGTHGMYDVDTPNSFNPIAPAVSALVYNTASAAVQYAAGCSRLVYAAVPFETIYPAAQRQAVMDRVIGFLGACLPIEAQYHTFLPLLIRAHEEALPTVCQDIIVNGGFESGGLTPGWYVLAANPLPIVITNTVHSGNYAARIGAATTSETITQTAYSSFGQTLSIPAKAITATLTVERYRYSGDSHNTQYAVVLDAANQVHFLFSDHADDAQWIHDQFDLQAYAGQTIKLWFSVYNSGTGGTAGMLIDDVQTQVCVP
jgi:N-acetylmuramoyl-L-alanine amidase